MATISNLDPERMEKKKHNYPIKTCEGLITRESDLVMPLGKINNKNSGKLITREDDLVMPCPISD